MTLKTILFIGLIAAMILPVIDNVDAEDGLVYLDPLESKSWWFETSIIPEADVLFINATFTNQDSFGRTLSFSDSTYQVWGYDAERVFIPIPYGPILIPYGPISQPTVPVSLNGTFSYEILIDLSDLPDLEIIAFRVVTIEGGTMQPSSVPNLGHDQEAMIVHLE